VFYVSGWSEYERSRILLICIRFSFLGYAAVKQVHVQSDISMPPITSSRDILTRAEGVPNSKQPPFFYGKYVFLRILIDYFSYSQSILPGSSDRELIIEWS